MATYKKDKGVHVKSYTADPDKTYPSAFEGQLYYNSSDGQFKYIGLGAGAWSSGGNLNNARFAASGTNSTGSQTAALAFGGDHMPTEPRMVGETESYDGSSWTEVADLNTARGQSGGGGTTTATICFGGEGQPPGFEALDVTETWNGSGWTETGDLNTVRYAHAGFGTTTSAICAGGGNPPSTASVEQWDGSSWTEVGDLNESKGKKGAGLTGSAGLVFGGSPAHSVNTEVWDGSSWTEVANMNTSKSNACGFGVSTSAICAGGTNDEGFLAVAELFDGTSWTEQADLALARNNQAPSGSATTGGLLAGGYAPPGSPTYGRVETEEWTYAHAFKKVTTG